MHSEIYASFPKSLIDWSLMGNLNSQQAEGKGSAPNIKELTALPMRPEQLLDAEALACWLRAEPEVQLGIQGLRVWGVDFRVSGL